MKKRICIIFLLIILLFLLVILIPKLTSDDIDSTLTNIDDVKNLYVMFKMTEK